MLARTRDGMRIVLSTIIGFQVGVELYDQAKFVSDQLATIIPERADGVLAKVAHGVLDPSTKEPWIQLFTLIAYFSSNNLLEAAKTDTFLKYVLDNKLESHLRRFLAINTPTTHAFATKIVKSAIRVKDITFLTKLLEQGVKFDSVLEDMLNIGDDNFFKLVLSRVSSQSFRGQLGQTLLNGAVSRAQFDIVKTLVEKGVVLSPIPGTVFHLPDFATEDQKIDLVRYLLQAGGYISEMAGILETAVRRGNHALIEFLLDQGASVSTTTIDGIDPLEWASLYSRETYHLLLAKTSSLPSPTVGDVIDAAGRGANALQHFLKRHHGASMHLLENALLHAAELANPTAVLSLLEHGVHPDAPSLSSYPLEKTVSIRDQRLRDEVRSILQLLINKGADINIPGVLYLIVRAGDFDLVRYLVASRINLKEHGPKALLGAIEDRNFGMVAYLLDAGVDINTSEDGYTPIQHAALWGCGDISMVQFLLSRGADINSPAKPHGGRTALQAALASPEGAEFEIANFLLDRGADVNGAPSLVNGVTALEAVCSAWYDDDEAALTLCKRLLDAGATIRCYNKRPSRLLHNLIEADWTDILSRVLNMGAKIGEMSENEYGDGSRTPLQTAAERGRLEAAKILVQHGADINEAPWYEHGRTSLQAAVSSEKPNLELVHYLLDRGANIHAKAAIRGGITALQAVAIKGNINLARLLMDRGADVNEAPALQEGRFAIEGAAEHGRLDMVQFLLNAGSLGDTTKKHGYERAIQLARENSHFAIVNLLEAVALDMARVVQA